MPLLSHVKFNRIMLKKCDVKEKLTLLKIQNTLVTRFALSSFFLKSRRRYNIKLSYK